MNRTTDVPQVVSLNGTWDFAYTLNIECRDAPVVPNEQQFVAKMPVPGYWDDNLRRLQCTNLWRETHFNPSFRPISIPMPDHLPEASLTYLIGVGWYRKSFDVPADLKSQKITLHIGGVVLEAWFWLNGNLIGYHLGHSTPFDIPLNRWLRIGEYNDLVIAVANIRHDRSGSVLRGYKGLSAGIYRSVYLKVTGRIRIMSCYLYPLSANQKLSSLCWMVELNSETGTRGFILSWTICDPENGQVMGHGSVKARSQCVSWNTETFGMQTWSDHSPKLYQVQVSVQEEDGTILDTMIQNFGLRILEREGTNLLLNGQPILLRGATEHCYYPLTCTPPIGIETYRDNIRKLKAIGFNFLRFHTWVPSEEYMQAADELGIMIQVEAPVSFGEQEWIDILRTCRKHPSVVIYCCGNEELLDERKIEYLHAMARLCRKFVPDALFNPQSALRGVEYGDLGKDIVQKPYPYNANRLKLLKQFSDVFGQYAWGFLSYSSVKADWHVLDKRMAIYECPCLSHELGIHGNYLNLDLEHRYTETRIGSKLFTSLRESLKKHGLLHKAAVYYRNSCAWMRILRKHVLESARKCKYVAGYDLLGAIDNNWLLSGYPCGIMNEFYELKPDETIADVLKYNGESVLLLDCSNHRNMTTGDDFKIDIFASLYGNGYLTKGRLSWYLADDRRYIHSKGEIPLTNIQNGVVEKLGTIEFSVPKLKRPSKLTVFARLSADEYEIMNDWNFWAFPKSRPINVNALADKTTRDRLGDYYSDLGSIQKHKQTQLRVVSAVNMDTLQFLNRGGKVILLGHEPFPALPTSFQLSLTGRTSGNLATVIFDHPLTRDFPHDGFCDWQFYSLLEGGSAIVFNNLGVPFNPIIEVVSSFKQIRKQANLFELKVGNGRLLVCTVNLALPDPSATYLLDRMLVYAQGKEFCPCTMITTEELSRLITTLKR